MTAPGSMPRWPGWAARSRAELDAPADGACAAPAGARRRGNLLIAHAGFGSVWRLSRTAEPLLGIRSCAGISTTNLAFGGPDGHDLVITESQTGSILRARLDVAGAATFSHQD